MLYDIDTDVPVPTVRTNGRSPRYPFRALAVAESFFEPEPDNVPRLQRAAAAYAKRAGIKLLTRRVMGEDGRIGLRVWRTA